MATRSLFLDDHGALVGMCDRVGCGLGLPWAGVVFSLAFAVVDVPARSPGSTNTAGSGSATNDAPVHEAFVAIAYSLICLRTLRESF